MDIILLLKDSKGKLQTTALGIKYQLSSELEVMSRWCDPNGHAAWCS